MAGAKGRAFSGVAFALICASVGLTLFEGDEGPTAQATATVLGTVGEMGDYHPVLKFKDRRGRAHTVPALDTYGYPRHEKGEKVHVRYEIDAPDKVRLESSLGRWGVLIACCIVGVAGLVLFLRTPQDWGACESPSSSASA